MQQPLLSPIAAAARLGGQRGRVLLHSGRNDDGLGTRSFVAANPTDTLIARGTSVVRLDRSGRITKQTTGDPFDAAEAFLAEHTCTLDGAMQKNPGVPEPRVIGYFGYDLGRFVEKLPNGQAPNGDVPDLWLSAYDGVACWNEGDHQPSIRGPRPDRLADELRRNALGDVAQPPPRFGPLVADDDSQRYFEQFKRIRDFLVAGDVYQVNLARRHIARVIEAGDSLAVYAALTNVAPAPFGALIEGDGFALISGSPERFLASSQGRIETRPIKGTRPVASSHEQQLAESEKDGAEHLMIVDLERNDLGRIARIGSVSVDALGYVVKLPALYHMVSRVSACPREGLGYAALLRATFPGGSITGAPKVRAMQIIAELEPARRGPYCGAFGYFGPTGFDLAISIRIGVVAHGELRIHVGGGIVADSDPAAELAETELKAQGWIQTLAQLGMTR